MTTTAKLGRATLAALAITTIFLSTGCATKEKQRIAMLEATNRELADRYNRLHEELKSANDTVGTLDAQLLAARRDNASLRNELASIPEPEMAAPGWTPVPGGAMIAIETGVLFNSGKAELRPEARRTLDGIVSTLQGEYSDKDVFVFGHTDDMPIKKSGWKDNWQLSSERALSVVRFLRERGVAAPRLAATGVGENRPNAPNDSQSNRAKNRRVEIYAVDPSVSPGS